MYCVDNFLLRRRVCVTFRKLNFSGERINYFFLFVSPRTTLFSLFSFVSVSFYFLPLNVPSDTHTHEHVHRDAWEKKKKMKLARRDTSVLHLCSSCLKLLVCY